MTEEQVKHDVLLAAQPTKQFVTVEQVGALALYLTSDAAASITGANLSDRRRLDRAVMNFLTRAFAPQRPKSAAATARSASISRCRAAARTARSPGACSTICCEDGRIEIEGISGTSAGAVNAVMLADGLARGGPEEARKRLADFWRAASRDGDMSKLQRAVLRPAVLADPDRRLADAGLVRRDVALSLALRPQPAQHQSAQGPDRALRRFRGGAQAATCQLFIAATNVHTGRLRIFSREKINADAVMASAALPYVFRAVEIDGVPYWDGGYTANPPIFPFFRTTADRGRAGGADQSGGARSRRRTSAQEIVNRINEITFNSSLIAEYRAIEFVAPADRPGPAAARHRAGRVPAHQRASHRSRLHRQEADAGQPAQHRFRFLRDAASRRPPRRAALPRCAFRRYRRAQHDRSARRKCAPKAASSCPAGGRPRRRPEPAPTLHIVPPSWL